MTDFKFTSPGVKFRERNITYVTQTVGVTTLGLVGETLKGPAFEPVYIQDKLQFLQRFGAQSYAKYSGGKLKYELPYVANAYLEESNQLWVTRVLGLSGYDAGTAWSLKLNAGLDPSSVTGDTPTTFLSTPFTGSTFSGQTITNSGQTGSFFTPITKTADTFNFMKITYDVLSFNSTGGTGTVSGTTLSLSGTAYTDFDNMVLATIRSRGVVTDNVDAPATTSYYTTAVTVSDTAIDNLTNSFTLSADTTGYNVSLNTNASNFLPYVVGVSNNDKTSKVFIESVYPELINYISANGVNYSTSPLLSGMTGVSYYGWGVKNTVITTSGNTNKINIGYKVQFQTPETPWVVSQRKGDDTIDRLFKFISISDGNSANAEIKISIENIDLAELEFDVIIRDFNDTDASKNILESFSRCSLVQTNTGYIGKRIGTSDGVYDLMSKYIMLEIAENIDAKSFPAGFEGYYVNNIDGGIAPKMIYKTSYSPTEKVNKAYLGITSNIFNLTGINQNMFNYNGYINGGETSGFTKTKGFHFDSGATGTFATVGEFEVGSGSFGTVQDVVSPTSPYNNIKTRKFTLVPSGGFDGWDIYRDSNTQSNVRTITDNYRLGGIYDGTLPTGTPANDYQAYEMGINTFANPEAVTINVFATPGLNWEDHTTLVEYTIAMIEDDRTDSLYVFDSPDRTLEYSVGVSKPDIVVAEDVVDSFSNTDFDSSYACTYFPWVQIKDVQNNVNVFLPPTGEVVKAIAYNDKVKAPWWAVAGLNRGVTDARKSKFKMSLDARDILYKGRINPMVDYAEVGTAIFGQKTTEVAESALNSINVRRLLLQVKVLISNVAVRLLFEQNDQATMDEFTSRVNPILETIKRERGLYEFYVKMDGTLNTPETIDRNELYGEIYLKPMRSVEKIGIGFTITPTGASFSNL